MAQLAIERQATSSENRPVSINWTSRMARPWARLFKSADNTPAEFFDRDAERVNRELELIRIRFPHHA
jgi:hypothetical protein